MIHEHNIGMGTDFLSDEFLNQNFTFTISTDKLNGEFLSPELHNNIVFTPEYTQCYGQPPTQLGELTCCRNNNSNNEYAGIIGTGTVESQLRDSGAGRYMNYEDERTEETTAANTSNASTVEDSSTEEAYAYLQGLNSENLMQFSQQSVLQEMVLKEHLEVKPNLDVLPTLEEHDIGGYNFQLNLNTPQKGKINWCYSDILHKVYIKMNDIFSFDVVYTPKLPLQNLRVRALLCFGKEVSSPVLRCQNHLSKDNEPDELVRHSLMRCENPTTEYRGTVEGRSINDRFSVVVPLGMCSMPKNDNSVHQTLALKFMCQNSCIGRRETSIMFLLEAMTGEILSQRVLDVKVCSCPKRDRDLDERNVQTMKRKMSDVVCPIERKMRRKVTQPKVSALRQESSTSEEESGKQFDIEPTPSGGYRMVVEFDTKEIAESSIKSMLVNAAAQIVMEPQHSTHHRRCYRRLKRLHNKILQKEPT